MQALKPNPKAFARLIESNLEIPTIPIVAQRALTMISDPEVSGGKLAQVIAEDQGLTARILKVANSAMYSLSREVRNLQQASMILGLDTLKTVIISVSCRMLYKSFGKVERTMWAHSVATAIAGQLIARSMDVAVREEAFVAGLMHDVGKVIMNNGARPQFLESVKRQATGASDLESEQEIFGFTHVDVGGLLVSRWGLSQQLEHAVFLHHDPELASMVAVGHEQLVYVTHLADRLADACGIGLFDGCGPVDPDLDDAAALLDLEPESIPDLKEKLVAMYETDQESFS